MLIRFGLLGERSRVPDHAVLVTKFNCAQYETTNNYHTQFVGGEKRFKMMKIPVDFMESELTQLAITNIITRLQSAMERQDDIDARNVGHNPYGQNPLVISGQNPYIVFHW